MLMDKIFTLFGPVTIDDQHALAREPRSPPVQPTDHEPELIPIIQGFLVCNGRWDGWSLLRLTQWSSQCLMRSCRFTVDLMKFHVGRLR